MKAKFNLKKIFKDSVKNPTIRNIAIVLSMTLFIKGLSFFKDVIVADKIGLSELLDTFFIAVFLAFFIRGVFFGAYGSVFIPNYVVELKSEKNNVRGFQSTTFIIVLVVSLLFVAVSVLVTDTYLEYFFSGHTESYYELVKIQFYYIVPCILFWGMSFILEGLLNIDEQFAHTSLGAIFTPATLIICLLFFREELGVIVLAVGTLIGSFLSLVYLLIIAIKRGLIKIGKPDFRSSNVIVMFQQMPAKLASGLLIGLIPLVDQYFSAQLVIGSISALNYGIKIPMLFLGITGIAVGNVLLPYFSKKTVDDRLSSFKELYKILRYTLLGGAIIGVILILVSYPIISILFERNEFTSDDSTVVSRIQQMYLIQVPFTIAALIIVKFLTSINRNNFMVLTSTVSLLLNIILNYILIKVMGVYGLALSTSIVALINFIILYAYINFLLKKQ